MWILYDALNTAIVAMLPISWRPDSTTVEWF